MTATNTLQSLHDYCVKSSGDATGQVWQGKNGTYQWNVGRETATGLVNGVVRKLAGIGASGKQIWVVAGSFKIDADGTITRFTGIPKKDQTLISRMGQITTQASAVVSQIQPELV